MKKLISLILAVMMIASLSITAFAETSQAKPEELVVETLPDESFVTAATSENNVTVKMSGSVPKKFVYHVSIEWKSLDFAFCFAENVTWNPVEHKYEAAPNMSEGQWTWTKGESLPENYDQTQTGQEYQLAEAITIKNHSNNSINIVAGFVEDDGVKFEKTTNGAKATVSDNAQPVTMPTAENTDKNSPPTYNYSVTMSGVPTTDEGFKLGTITVTISKPTT